MIVENLTFDENLTYDENLIFDENLTYDENLTFNDDVKNVSTKISKSVGVMRRLHCQLPADVMAKATSSKKIESKQMQFTEPHNKCKHHQQLFCNSREENVQRRDTEESDQWT